MVQVGGTSTGKQPTVLIVDDEVSVAETLSLILQAHGYQTIVAHSGESAVLLAREAAPDALVCDIVMPGMSGIETAIEIRGLCPVCRILLISGQMLSDELLDKARADGHDFEVLAKPFHPNLLIERLRGGTLAPA